MVDNTVIHIPFSQKQDIIFKMKNIVITTTDLWILQ